MKKSRSKMRGTEYNLYPIFVPKSEKLIVANRVTCFSISCCSAKSPTRVMRFVRFGATASAECTQFQTLNRKKRWIQGRTFFTRSRQYFKVRCYKFV